MARQRGNNILTGKIGGISFYNSRYGPLARSIGTVSKERFNNDPKLAARKDAAMEFGYAARVGKLLRLAVKYVNGSLEVGTTHYRLTAALRRALKSDNVNARGQRKLVASNVGLLKGFDWREDEPVHLAIRTAYEVMLDAANGTAALEIPALVPGSHLVVAEGATHVEIFLMVAAVDEAGDRQVNTSAASGKISLKGE